MSISAPGSLSSSLRPLSIRDLRSTSGSLDALLKRQRKICSAGPGGPECSATTCCAAGQQCVDDTGCCEATMFICSELGCCDTAAACCGDGCCPEGSICEQNECIDESLKDRIYRFEIMDNNQALLRNMCNGMRGKNTDTLTYRGPDKAERDQTRKDAGCVPGFCAKQIAAGLIDPSFNSCDEYPPASSLEGGKPDDELFRTANCIPSRQNSHQGGKLSSLGKNLKRGDQFVISIDCDKVLGSRKRELAHEVETREVHEVRNNAGIILNARDGESVSKSGNETVDHDVLPDDTSGSKSKQPSFLLAPFGDLDPGNNGTGLKSGRSQEFTFVLDDWTPGNGIVVQPANTSSTGSSAVGPSATASPSSAEQFVNYRSLDNVIYWSIYGGISDTALRIASSTVRA
ncbi:hypothetical protein NP233_g1466 [Leucocoprinus birnbaumii]|uniref:Deoxyribonuclease NucA/NucB domain-containing protein n=1 Tax=Leucocoprinus birnbaumii TaxID=56174 RepID=A0AAD5W0H9_9AGAR|nr:hypothetical protein NP233_g1466 [Leucocoprinus birnbaumii]